MRDELDNLIDGALSGYSAAEPLAGLEERVLRRVWSVRRARRWRWMGALALAAAAVLGVVVRPRPASELPVVAVVAPPAPPVSVAPTRAAARVVKRGGPRRAAVEPVKKNVFPTISPLTVEEKLLVQMAESHPEQLAPPPEEIVIKSIEIAPLDINGGQ